MVTNRAGKSALTNPPSAGQASREIATLNGRSAGRLREPDRWRAISVLLVALHHIGAYWHPHSISRFLVLIHLESVNNFRLLA